MKDFSTENAVFGDFELPSHAKERNLRQILIGHARDAAIKAGASLHPRIDALRKEQECFSD